MLALLTSGSAYAGSGALRITCDGDNDGSSIYINGKLKGECPIDLKVPEGTVKLSARKKYDHGEYRFYQEFHMGDGAAKKVEVWAVSVVTSDLTMANQAEAGDPEAMSSIQGHYSAYGAYSKNVDEARKSYEQALRWGLKAVDAGAKSPRLMFDLGDMYRHGRGTDVNTERAEKWYKRGLELGEAAADEGDTDAMKALASAYVLGKGVSVDKSEAARWLNKAKDKGADVDWLFKLYKLQ
jgi:TPR repeat protein